MGILDCVTQSGIFFVRACISSRKLLNFNYLLNRKADLRAFRIVLNCLYDGEGYLKNYLFIIFRYQILLNSIQNVNNRFERDNFVPNLGSLSIYG